MSEQPVRAPKIRTQMEADKACEKKGIHFIDGGLILKVKEKGGRCYPEYFVRIQIDRKRRDLYLKSARKMKLREAKVLAGKVRQAIQNGDDWEALLKRKTPAQIDFSLSAVFDRYFATVEPGLKRDGDASRWWSQIRTHLIPALGNKDVRKLTRHQMADAIRPLYSARDGFDRWGNAKTLRAAPETAKRALMRLKGAIEFAAAETRDVDLSEIEAVPTLLPKVQKSKARVASVPWDQIATVYAGVCDLDQTPARLALRLLILTAHRVGAIKVARVHDFDLKSRLWTIPHGDLKKPFTDEDGSPMDYRCPLSREACDVVTLAMRQAKDGVLFPGGHSAKHVSDVSVGKTLKKVVEKGTAHGMRATFRGWAVNHGGSFELIETVLQHRVGGSVTQAYMRDDFLEKRRDLMENWSLFVAADRDAVQRSNLRIIK